MDSTLFFDRKHGGSRAQILLGEFAGIPADYEAHRKQIFAKLASIMEDVWARNTKVRAGICFCVSRKWNTGACALQLLLSSSLPRPYY
jgi:hypothetical protein